MLKNLEKCLGILSSCYGRSAIYDSADNLRCRCLAKA
jgi:hypothetical protein